MDHVQEKLKHGERLQQKEKKLARRMKQAKEWGLDHVLKEPHKYHKHSPFSCGDSDCVMCGNPRKFFKEPTIQEQRASQDMETMRDKRSNGKVVDEIDVYLRVRNGE